MNNRNLSAMLVVSTLSDVKNLANSNIYSERNHQRTDSRSKRLMESLRSTLRHGNINARYYFAAASFDKCLDQLMSNINYYEKNHEFRNYDIRNEAAFAYSVAAGIIKNQSNLIVNDRQWVALAKQARELYQELQLPDRIEKLNHLLGDQNV